MNKILFAALAALVITGCSQNENDAPGNNAEIRFNTIVNKATIGSASRATPMVTANFENFTVYGYNPEVKFDGTGSLGASFMEGVSATKSGTWSLAGGPYYWPAKGIPAFFAYSPATNVKDYAVGDPAGYPSFSYTIQDTQEDLLVAQKLDAVNAATPISLAFSHILTQINFSAELEAGFDYVVTKIEIAGVNNEGTFTYAATNPGWTATTGTVAYEYAGNYSATPANNLVDFSTSTNALLLLPQTVPANATISVTYKATPTNGNQQATFDGTKSVDLNAAVWAIGKNIRYKLKLASGGQEISFEPIVDSWVDEESAQEPK